MGATFALTESVVANQRKKDDYLNGVAGGCAAGFLAGIRGTSLCQCSRKHISERAPLARSLPMALASCAFLGTAVGTYDYGGRNLFGSPEETAEERRKRFFKHPPPDRFAAPGPSQNE